MINNFAIKNNKLVIGDVFAEDLVKTFGSPLYVYDAELIRQRFRELKESISYADTSFYYACKQNTNLALITLLKKEGAKIEVMSKSEIMIALQAGYNSNEMIYTCSYISREEMAFVISKGILMNLDSLTQIKRYGELNPGGKISLRINQGIGAGGHAHIITGGPESKFGIDITQIVQAKKLAAKYNLQIIGIHQHIGSNILDEKIFLKAVTTLLKTAKSFSSLEHIDFGGGFGVPYDLTQQPLQLHALGKKITAAVEKFVKEYKRPIQIQFEPGRFYVAEAGILLATVTEIKQTPTKKFVGIDAGMNQFLRPALYGAYHQIVNASAVIGKEETVSVVGNICESADFFARDRNFSEFHEDDTIAILDVGASGYSMASFYNGRPMPAEILVDRNKTKLIRREREADLNN